jgi:hypothetical protein
MMIPETGPYLKAAAICADVIEGKDGVLSIIRIIDRTIITAAGPDAPEQMPAVPQRLKLVLMLVSGRARGTQQAKVTVENPIGMNDDVWSGTLFFEGEDRGANCIIEMEMAFPAEGLYWFSVSLEGNLLTKLPFRLIYERAQHGLRPR